MKKTIIYLSVLCFIVGFALGYSYGVYTALDFIAEKAYHLFKGQDLLNNINQEQLKELLRQYYRIKN